VQPHIVIVFIISAATLSIGVEFVPAPLGLVQSASVALMRAGGVRGLVVRFGGGLAALLFGRLL
jgi:hypothetical protein